MIEELAREVWTLFLRIFHSVAELHEPERWAP